MEPVPSQDLKITDYQPGACGWRGYIEPKDRSWILFIHDDGTPVLFPKRDPTTGEVLTPPV